MEGSLLDGIVPVGDHPTDRATVEEPLKRTQLPAGLKGLGPHDELSLSLSLSLFLSQAMFGVEILMYNVSLTHSCMYVYK